MLGPSACIVLTDTPKVISRDKLAVRADLKGHKLAQLLVERPVTRAKDIKKPAIKQRFRVEMTEDTAAVVAIDIEKTGETSHPGYDQPTSRLMQRTVT